MNQKQKTIVTMGLFILGAILLFPPWEVLYSGITFDLGYSFVWEPPVYQGELTGSISLKRLLAQIFGITSVFFALFIAVKDK